MVISFHYIHCSAQVNKKPQMRKCNGHLSNKNVLSNFLKEFLLNSPTGVVSEMLKAAGETGTMWMTDVCNAVVRDGKISEDWSWSWMVNVYKGKGDALTCGLYRGIELLEHAMKVLERVIEGRVRKIGKIDDMQFGFMAGRSTTDAILYLYYRCTTDAIFIVRQLQENYLARNKELWMAFVDLEKAFDRVLTT